ncbi:MAG: helix-turn-helix domain-containing protein [Saprospiraceae bacterium]|mgnify:FL=1|nr:helix-turn-helix domain-containing protein [Saprospiraceae bacterium]
MAKPSSTRLKLFPITTEAEYHKANEIIESLLDCREGSEEEKILEAITILAIEYEKKHHAIPKPDPIVALKYRLEELNLSQKDVSKYFGGENRVSEVLNRKRNLSLRMIKNMYKYLGIPGSVLLSK